MKMEQLRLRVLFVILVGVVCYGVAYDLGFDPWMPALVGGWITTIVVVVERGLTRVSIRGLMIGGLGLGVGVVLANLLAYPILLIDPLKQLAPLILLLINVIFASVGLTVAVKREEEITNFLSHLTGKKTQIREAKYKILDTSVIIDGRIADLCETGFIEGTLVIPNFVLTELQQIADSSAATKRTRGRRGLDMVNRLQNQENIPVQILDRDFPDIPEVDSKLLQLAKIMEAQIITNDHNLKKVAKIQNVKVLNINELATALKPVLLPGESLRIGILKEGENPNQGVAYLEDGTMVVIEGGKKYIGKETEVLVTSVLQTTTGKMIFTEIKDETGKERKRRRSNKG
ncbi:MAG: PIN/TRAM domain-containing protein [bacterium]